MPQVIEGSDSVGELWNGKTGIGDYGIIGDCRTAAVISKHGPIDWRDAKWTR